MGGLISYILDETDSSHFYLKGWRRLTQERLAFVVTLALCSRVTDSLQAELIVDARVALRFEELAATLEEEVDWLMGIPWFVAASIAPLGGMTVPELRTNLCKVSHVMVGFINERVFQHLQEHPFSLAVGGLERLSENLIDMEAGPEPDEQMAKQLWLLMHMGYPKHRLIGVLLLLQRLEWTTLTAEQLHAGAALMMRHHPDYGMSTLLSRTMTHMARRLLPSRDAEEKLLDKSQRKLAREIATCPERCAGSSIFIKDLMAVARKKYGQGPGSGRPPKLTSTIIKGAARQFNKQSEQTKRKYAELAKTHASEQVQARNARIEELRSAIAISQQRIVENPKAQGSMRLSLCAFAHADFEKFLELMGAPKFDQEQLDYNRKVSLGPAEPLSSGVLLRMHKFAVAEQPAEVLPEWLSTVALFRSFFQHAALRFQVNGEQQVWKFCFAKQSPRAMVMVTRMQVEPFYHDCSEEITGESWARIGDRHVTHAFSMDILKVVSAATWGCVAAEGVDVIDNLEWHGDSTMVTNATFVPFKTFIDDLPSPNTGATKKRSKKVTSAEEAKAQQALVMELPWVEKFWKENIEIADEPEPTQPQDTEWPDEDFMSDGEVEAVYDELNRARSDLAAEIGVAVGIVDFDNTILGGEWTKKHTEEGF